MKRHTLIKVGAAALALCVLAGCGSGMRIPPNDPLYGEQTNLSDIYVEDAWRAGFTGAGVTIAVIDTGFNPHEDVDASRVSGKSYSVNSDGAVTSADSGYADVVGHGSSIVGLLAATRNNGIGIAGLTDSNILALRVDDGTAPAMSVDIVAQAIRDAADAGCGVIDISVGTPTASDTLKSACDYAEGKGCIVIAAAGGDANTPYYPAAYDSVIGVDGLGANLQPSGAAADNNSVFVTAPGTDIVSIDNQNGYIHDGAGASYAAAQVAALAAFAKQDHPDMTADQFRTLLKQTVRNMSGGDYSTRYGWGIISCVAFAEALKWDNFT